MQICERKHDIPQKPDNHCQFSVSTKKYENYLKKNKRYREEMVFAETPLHPVSNENPVVQLDARQLGDLIRQLPVGFQTIFNLYAIEGYTHAEIGQLLGISDGTSKSQYARARYLLIEWIEKYSSLPKNEQYAGK